MALNLSFLDLSIIVVYLVLCLVFGFLKSNKANSLREYAVGTGYISNFALIATIFATYIGAGNTVGRVEKIYSLGIIYAIPFLFSPVLWLITGRVFANVVEKFPGCISLTDIMQKLYGAPGRWVTAFASIILSIGVTAAQYSALGFLFEHFSALPRLYGILLGCIIVTSYIYFGGAKSLVTTDLFQFIVFYIAIPVACAIAFSKTNGYEGIVSTLPKEMLTLDLHGEHLWLFLSFIFYGLMPLTDSTFVQRFLMARNATQLKHVMNRIFFLAVSFSLVLALIGFTVKALIPDIEPNQAFYYLVSHYFPSGVIGLVIAGMFAIIMSTTNSFLNSAAVICANDVAKIFKPNLSATDELRVAKLSTLGISLVSLLVACYGNSVIELIWAAENFWYPLTVCPVIMGFAGIRTNNRTFVIAALFATATVFTTAYFTGGFGTLGIFFGILSSFISFLTAHYWQHPGDINRLLKVLKLPKLINSFKLNAHEDASKYFTFSIFAIFQYIPSIFESAISGTIENEILLSVKLSAIFCAITFFTYDMWSIKYQKKIAPTLWYLNIFYLLCFVSSLLLIANANKVVWLVNSLLSVILITMLLPLAQSILMMISGAIMAEIFFKHVMQGIAIGSEITHNLQFALAAGYGFMGIVLIYITKTNSINRENQLNSQVSFAAHEASSPLTATVMGLNLIDEIIEDASKRSNKAGVSLNKNELSQIQSLLSKLQNTAQGGLQSVTSIVRNFTNEYSDIGEHKFTDLLNSLKEYPQVKMEIAPSMSFYGSKEGILTVIRNLLNNAIKYAGSNAEIRLLAYSDTIVIEDNGVGIADEIKNKMFFQRITSAGNGLGLVLCKKILDEHGFTIKCNTRPGFGTSFIITTKSMANNA